MRTDNKDAGGPSYKAVAHQRELKTKTLEEEDRHVSKTGNIEPSSRYFLEKQQELHENLKKSNKSALEILQHEWDLQTRKQEDRP